MPYIPEDLREQFAIDAIASNPGQLNYLFTRASTLYLSQRGRSYQTLNDCIGALECCKAEFYRRVVVPYEEQKKEVNGDVF